MFQKIKEKITNIPNYEILIPFLIFCVLFIFGTISLLPVLSSFIFMKFSDFVLLATLTALLWYSFETRQLKNAARTANELQQLPFFVLIYNERTLTLKNEGMGMAYNIAVDDIRLGDENFEFNHLRKWYYCSPNEQRELTVEKSIGDRCFSAEIKDLVYDVWQYAPNKKIKLTIRFNSPLKNRASQAIVLKVPDDPVYMENIELYNFEE